jgi:hypothetical protein
MYDPPSWFGGSEGSESNIPDAIPMGMTAETRNGMIHPGIIAKQAIAEYFRMRCL